MSGSDDADVGGGTPGGSQPEGELTYASTAEVSAVTGRPAEPIYRCEWCSYHEPRNGQVEPRCPYCIDGKTHGVERGPLLWKAMR